MRTQYLVLTVGFSLFLSSARVDAQTLYAPPPSGWLYSFTGDAAAPGSGAGVFDSLDGTWARGNGSDSWDTSALGVGNPGGISALVEDSTAFIRIQDPGDPRDYGLTDPSNRKVYLGRDLTALGASGTVMDDGVTLSFRAKVPTTGLLDNLYPNGGGGIVPYPVTGDGYRIHDGGKGNFGIHQAGNNGIISFSLATSEETGSSAGLVMNNLNGTAISANVDTGEAGTVNLLPLDPTQWHEFWITIKAGGAGTHQVKVYMDGSLTPTDFDVTIGNGNDYSGLTYLGMGLGSTDPGGAVDVDFFAVAAGEFTPVSSSTPPGTPTALTEFSQDARVSLGWSASLGATGYVIKRATVSGGPYTAVATNTTLIFVDTTVVNGTVYYYVVSAFNDYGESANSTEIVARPNIAPVVVATGKTNLVELTWNALAGATGYAVSRADTDGGPYTVVASGIAATEFLDTGLESGQRYYYVVAATLSGGVPGGYSSQVEAITAPSDVTDAVAELFAATVAKVSFRSVDPVTPTIWIERSDNGVAFAPLTNLTAGTGYVLDAGLPSATTVHYRLYATNAGGGSSRMTYVSVFTPSGGYDVNFATGPNNTAGHPVAPVPEGYVQDVGELFGDRGNGLFYGWATPAGTNIVSDARYHRSPNSPDLRYDTFNHLQKGVGVGILNAVWEIQLPNGLYRVHAVAGDPNATGGTFQFDIEGGLTRAYMPSDENRWGEFTNTAYVGDGRLTINSTTNCDNNKINFVNLYPADPAPNILVSNPVSRTVAEHRTATFNVAVGGGPEPYTVQWYFNNNPIFGATLPTLTIPSAQETDEGDYYAVIANASIQVDPTTAVTSTVARLMVSPDTAGPLILSATRGACSIDRITMVFDELLDPVTGGDFFSYTVENLTENAVGNVTTVTMHADGQTVSVRSDLLITNGAVYRMIANVNDILGNPSQSQAVVTLLGALQPGGPQNIVVAEAEHADEMVPRVWEGVDRYWEFTTERGGFSGEGSMRALPNTEGNRPAGNEATSLDFCVNFPAAGTYYFWVRGGCNGGADNSCHVGINDTVPDTAQNVSAGFDTGTSSGFVWTGTHDAGTAGRTMVVVPAPGPHRVQVYMREDGFYCDKILLTTDSGYNPSTVNGGLGPDESPRDNPNPTTILTIGRAGDRVTIAWTGPGRLQSADEVTGDWSEVPAATSPYAVTAVEAQQYYRVVFP